jgi:hypothetical protein
MNKGEGYDVICRRFFESNANKALVIVLFVNKKFVIILFENKKFDMTEFSFQLAFDEPISVVARDFNHRAG